MSAFRTRGSAPSAPARDSPTQTDSKTSGLKMFIKGLFGWGNAVQSSAVRCIRFTPSRTEPQASSVLHLDGSEIESLARPDIDPRLGKTRWRWRDSLLRKSSGLVRTAADSLRFLPPPDSAHGSPVGGTSEGVSTSSSCSEFTLAMDSHFRKARDACDPTVWKNLSSLSGGDHLDGSVVV